MATPIGNLKDITLRALEILKQVDVIACEDTRHTLKLLNHYNISKPLISYHKHKEKAGNQQILKMLKDGKSVAVVSDAGMPCVSDPGASLVGEIRQEGLEITVCPGASALTAAVSLSGIEGPFTFLGFLSDNKKQRDSLLQSVKDTPCSLVVYCSPHDLQKTLNVLYENLGKRAVSIIKEMTKIHEKVIEGTLGEITLEQAPKGEFVIVIEPPRQRTHAISDDEIRELLKEYIAQGLSKKDAAIKVSKEKGVSKNTAYNLSVNI